MMTFRELIQKQYRIDIPISGGTGKTIDDAVVLELVKPYNEYVATERMFLTFMAVQRGVKWKKIGQQLISHNGREIDKIYIETKQRIQNKTIKTMEEWYFDITECFHYRPVFE